MNATGLSRLLSTARAVWVAIRAVEVAVVAGTFAAFVGLVVVVVQAWLGEASFSLVLTIIAAGAVCGALGSFIRVPSKLAVAERIDRQFKLHDLLSSALQIESSPGSHDDAMRKLILTQAAIAARGIPLGGIAFQRYTRRTYGGAVLAVAMALTMSAIASPHKGSTGSFKTSMGTSRPPTIDREHSDGETARRSPREHSHVGQAPSTDAAPPIKPAQESTPRHSVPERKSAAPAKGQSASSASGTTPETTATLAVTPTGGSNQSSVTGLAGSGTISKQSGTAEPRGEVTDPDKPRSPPASLNQPGAARGDPRSAGKSIPPAYRDLVRAFFARD